MSAKPLSIKDWNNGIGESPYVGYGQMVNVDIFTKPGSLKISNRLNRDTHSVGIVRELIILAAKDPKTSDDYFVDRNGTLYKREFGTTLWSIITGHGTAGMGGQGLTIWRDYLFYARNNKLDVYALPSSPNGDAGTWYNNWAPVPPYANYNLESCFTHPILNAMDGHLYIGNAGFVDTLQHISINPFKPSDTSTFSYNSPQLTLNPNYIVSTLEDNNGVGVAIGTKYGTLGNFNVADMFFWDGASATYTSPGTNRFSEDGVQMTKNIGGVYYTIAGTGIPRIFRSVSAQAVEAKRLNNVGDSGNVTLFAAGIEQIEGEILFGIGQNEGVGGVHPMGVYSLRPTSSGALSYVTRYLPSTGNDGSTGRLMIGVIQQISLTQFVISWADSASPDSFGVDVLSIDNFYTNYEAYVETPIYTVGTEDDPTTFEEIEVRLGKKLNTGDGVIVKARRSLDDTWTTIVTFDTPTYVGRDFMKKSVASLSKFKDAQFRIELTTDISSVESPELKEVVLQ